MRNAEPEWSIELLRGVAALMVVVAHYIPVAGLPRGAWSFAFSGVDLFFVLSGYVFAPYLFGRPLRWAPHLVRRVFRIYPLYLVALAGYVGLRWVEGRDTPFVVSHLFFLHTFRSYEEAFFYNPAFWSLPPEVEYYLLLPLLALLARGGRAFWWIAGIALAVHLLAAGFSPASPAVLNAWFVASRHLPGLLVEFMVGMVVWHASRSFPPGRGLRLLASLVGCLLWSFSAGAWTLLGDAGVTAQPLLRGNIGLLAALAFGLMVYAWLGLVKLPSAPIVGVSLLLGNLSYGTYLFHNAMPELLGGVLSSLSRPVFAVVCALATLVLAGVLHYLVERPAREYGRGLAGRLA